MVSEKDLELDAVVRCPTNFSLSCLAEVSNRGNNDKLKFVGHFRPEVIDVSNQRSVSFGCEFGRWRAFRLWRKDASEFRGRLAEFKF